MPDAGILAAYARQQWEALLLYLVGGEGTTPVAPPELQAASIDIRGLLVAAGLMAKDERTQRQSGLALGHVHTWCRPHPGFPLSAPDSQPTHLAS